MLGEDFFCQKSRWHGLFGKCNMRRYLTFFVKHWPIISILVLLVITFALFTYFQAVPAFADPDSFYHIKMAQLIPHQGIIKTFPWLQFTILRDTYIDQHFLYHVFLIPFVYLMDPIQGAKLATVILCSGLIILFYLFLRSEKIKFAFVFALILLASMPFIFRINLVKAPVFSIILLLSGVWLMFKNKKWPLAILSFLYVWAYGGFVVVLVAAGAYMVVGLLVDAFSHGKHIPVWRVIKRNQELRLFLFCLAGVVAGILVNPQFPQNLIFYWHQLVKIGIINYQNVISVGNEWYPYKFTDLTASTAMISVIVLVALYLCVVNFRRPSKKVMTTFLIFLFFLIFTLKSRRYVEYYVPFALLFGAFGLDYYMWRISWRSIWEKFLHFYFHHRIITTILVIYFLATVPTLVLKDAHGTYNDLRNGIAITRFASASAWLEQHSQPGDIVFHSSWDEFPMLFYFNSKDYYIFGLDPTFSYEYSHELHQKIVDITTGKQVANLHDDLKNTFRASYVFVEKKHTSMNTNIKSDAGFAEVYADNEATVYRVL